MRLNILLQARVILHGAKQKDRTLEIERANVCILMIDASQGITEQDEKSNRVRLTAKQRKVLEFCDVVPRTAQEILEMVGVQYHTKTLDQYVNKLVGAGLLRPTGAKIHDSNRRYITAHNE